MPPNNQENKLKALFENRLFDVEHALNMYAVDYGLLPAEVIYEKDLLAPHMAVIEKCHIYLIGYTPKIEFIGAAKNDKTVRLDFQVSGEDQSIEFKVPAEWKLRDEGETVFLEDLDGNGRWPDENTILEKLSNRAGNMKFVVKYVGQSYGKNGSRNAIDRLLKHETLQRISLKGVPAGQRISLLLLSILPANRLISVMNPWAQNKDDDGQRIRAGLDKLFNTTEEERISLYEAALIRYFCPEYNKEFKDSFPSTNLKILHDCYKKDFSALIAEINFDHLPYYLCSEIVPPAHSHIAKHDLHRDDERRIFFSLDGK